MDTIFQEFPNSINNLKFYHCPNLVHGYAHNTRFSNFEPPSDSVKSDPLHEFRSFSSPSSSSEGDYPKRDVILKFISDMLMEEDLEGKTCMLQDSLALQAAEKSFYDVLGQDYPNSFNQLPSCFDRHVQSPDYGTVVESLNSKLVFDQANLVLPHVQGSSIDTPESILQNPDHFWSQMRQSGTPESKNSSNSSRGRKNHQREDGGDIEEERRNKHSALSLPESENSEMFDVLLCPVETNDSMAGTSRDKPAGESGANVPQKGSNGRKNRAKKRGKKGELVDLWTILTQCAQAVASSDQRTANELLKQIRQHSSPHGDGNQRMAHYVANALETRLAGTKTPMYTAFVSHKTSMADILKAHQVYVRACPYKRMSNFYANRTIMKVAAKATRLHIIDFGILYGFQWPCIIQRLSERPGGPPKLCITGIELPQPGFRPAERVEETGHRLRRYCERFNVPFEYHVIAKKWETIKYEDLSIGRDEVIVVNCLYRLKHLPDDTIVANSARDTVLKLIKRINPDIFINGVLNGTYNAPFFLTQFREALFHYSSQFDMFEANVSREDEKRELFEKEVFGRDIMNVIACEGMERVERPETYKQWQVRSLRAGFRQLPLDQEILKKVKTTVKAEYNRDFVVDEDGHWMLQGWKGRILYALSVWKPVRG